MPFDASNASYPGHNAYEYLNLGTYDTPVWTRIARVEDVGIEDNRSENDLKLKESAWVKNIRGRRARQVTFKYTKKRGTDAIYNELLAAYEGEDVCVEYAATDLPITTPGAKGFRAPMNVAKFDEDRTQEQAVTVEVTLKLQDAVHPLYYPQSWEPEAILVA